MPSVVRRVAEILAGADLATWFVRAQHHGPVRALAEAGGLADLVAELASGRRIAGIAFSHPRRWPARRVTVNVNPAAREGLFLLVQAQTAEARRTTLQTCQGSRSGHLPAG